MAVCFGIQLLGVNPDFNDSFQTIMWDENTGPVEVGEPAFQITTVYRYGDTAMEVGNTLGYATRIVSLSTNVNSPTNSFQFGSPRTAEIVFQLRVPGFGGILGLFYNFDSGINDDMTFEDSKGFSSFSRSLASEARSPNFPPGTIYDFFQQTFNNR